MNGFAIICDPHDPGVPRHCTVVAMVDRNKERTTWWTATAFHKVMRFNSRMAAVERAEKLKHNPRVVSYDSALRSISAQAQMERELTSC